MFAKIDPKSLNLLSDFGDWSVALAAFIIPITIQLALALLAPARADVDRYEVYDVRFATLANFPVSSLVAGADRARRMDTAMMIWVLPAPIVGRASCCRSTA